MKHFTRAVPNRPHNQVNLIPNQMTLEESKGMNKTLKIISFRHWHVLNRTASNFEAINFRSGIQ